MSDHKNFQNIEEKLKEIVDAKNIAAIFCRADPKKILRHPLIVHANKKFSKIFGFKDRNLVGKNYDFLFENLDFDNARSDQLEYIKLIKSVKNFQECEISIAIGRFSKVRRGANFKVIFKPYLIENQLSEYSILTFEEIFVDDHSENKYESSERGSLLRSLERSLRSERLLREVSALIISDLQIYEIAQNIAQILCEYLRVDRCIIHDYQNSQTSFFVEYCGYGCKEMLKDKEDNPEVIKIISKYISFQNHFYERCVVEKSRSNVSIVRDTLNDKNFLPIYEICEKFSIFSQVVASTVCNKKVNGGIYLHQSSKREWLADEIELIEIIADQFSIALDRSCSIEKVMIANHALIEKTTQLKETLKHEKEMRKMQNEFVALVSHEFKTPLQIIDSTREVMVRKIKNLNIFDESLNHA